MTFCSLLPQVIELSAAGNGLKDFLFSGRLLRYLFCLKSLIIDDNDIRSLFDIRDLTGVPTLQCISLKRNKIAEIKSIDPHHLALKFSPTLTELDLSGNLITHWASVHGIASIFPGLTALRLTSNPLYSMLGASGRAAADVEDDAFMLTLARIESLTTLNHSKVDVSVKHTRLLNTDMF